MPVTLPYGRERARVARLVLSLLRTVRRQAELSARKTVLSQVSAEGSL